MTTPGEPMNERRGSPPEEALAANSAAPPPQRSAREERRLAPACTPCRRDVAVILAQHNRVELTLECLKSLQRVHPDAGRVIVVDDGSSPESVRRVLAARFAGVELILQSRRGVTAAWNAGARDCEAPLLVFLNNDVRTTGPWLDAILSPLHAETCVASGPELRTERAVPASRLRRLPTDTFLAGWCLAVRRADFERLGGFDERFEMYFSDTDLQARLLNDPAGLPARLAAWGGAGLVHLGHGTTRGWSERSDVWRRDRRTFMRIWQERADGGRRARNAFEHTAPVCEAGACGAVPRECTTAAPAGRDSDIEFEAAVIDRGIDGAGPLG